jgi:hypothetical protein
LTFRGETFSLHRICDNDCGRPLVRRAKFAGCEACEAVDGGLALHLLMDIWPLHSGDTFEVLHSTGRVAVVSAFKRVVYSIWRGRFEVFVVPNGRRSLGNISVSFDPARLPS